MPGTNLITFLVIGILAGFVAEKVMKADHGLLTNLIVGIVGSYIGGFLMNFLGIIHPANFIANLVVASIGAILLLFILRKVKGK